MILSLKKCSRAAIAVALSCLLLGFSPHRSASAEEGKLRVATEVGYEPFSYADAAGTPAGFDVEIAQALCATMKRECEIIFMPFDDIIPAVAKGDVDLGAVGLGITPEREKIVDFTDYYYRSQSIFIERPGRVRSLSPEDMEGTRVGVQPGSIQEEYLRKVYGARVTLVPAADFERIFQDLREGHSDIVLVDGLSGYATLKSPLGAGLETLGTPISDGLVATSAHMIVPKGREELRKEINKAIREIVRTGEFARINRKYFEFTVY